MARIRLPFSLTLVTLVVHLTALSTTEAGPRLTHRQIQTVDSSVRDFFHQDGKRVREIWGHQIEKCSGGEGCTYYVDTLADAQVGYGFQYGVHECRTYLAGPRKNPEAQSTDCEFVGN